MAKRLQEQEGRPLSVEDRDRLIAIETQDCEFAKLLQEKVIIIYSIDVSWLFFKYNIILGKSSVEKSS